MDTTNAPQMVDHLNKSIAFTPFETRWIPNSAKFILAGQTPSAKGVMQIYQLDRSELKLIKEFNPNIGIKCGTFGISDFNHSDFSWGDFEGNLNIMDLEKQHLKYKVKAHSKIVNAIDGVGGLNCGNGAPELVTAGRDGCIRVWDPRQESAVLSLEPVDKENIPDAWSVGFGNSYNNQERVVASGYDNGDVKLFDLRANKLIFDHNVQNGVCGIEFDRKDIMMNKLVCTTLEGKFHIFDLRTNHPEEGFANLKQKGQSGTIWGLRHCPQNRELFGTLGGDGSFNLYKYHYPIERQIKDVNGRNKGVVGNVELLNNKAVTTQPIVSFDWHRDKLGLSVMSCLDQTVRVQITTKLNLY